MDETAPSTWARDPVVGLCALFAMAAHGLVFFSGTYLPYYDWPSHLGFISILHHGREAGSLQYLHLSFAPNPYSLYYYLSAALASLLGPIAGSKLALVLASGGMTLSLADLLEQHGRDPRQAALAPMALFGYALGYGFVSFVFSLPFFFVVLAWLERLLRSLSNADSIRRPLIGLSIALSLCYLGHALVFIGVSIVVGTRVLLFLISYRTSVRRRVLGLACILLSYGPVAGLILIRLSTLELDQATETTDGVKGPWVTFPTMMDRLNNLPAYLIDRGDAAHMTSMWWVLALFATMVVLSQFVGRMRTRAQLESLRFGFVSVVAGTAGLFFLGPNAILRPFNVWLFHSRFATMAALTLFCLPKIRLRNAAGLTLVALMLGVLCFDAALQRNHVVWLSQLAEPYDRVRALIPPKTRVLALTYGTAPNDRSRYHPNLGNLYFYHLADGAAYSAFLFDNPLIPVQFRTDVDRPRAPFWRTPFQFSPETHGRDFDYLVLRGAPVGRAARSQHHRRVAEVEGWVIFETLNPSPWPQGPP